MKAKRVLVDTDVVLDCLLDRVPFANDATAVLALCEQGSVRGFITPLIISNTYYLLRRISKASHNDVIDKLKVLLSILGVLPMDENTVLIALNSDFKDFEDALQNTAAEQISDIDFIVTRNVKDYSKSSLEVLHPHDFVNIHLCP